VPFTKEDTVTRPRSLFRGGIAAAGAAVFVPALAAADGFLPHAVCYLWDPALLSVHAITDSLIGLSYVAISAALGYLVYRARRGVPYHWMFVAFGAFIVACGATHFMEVWTLWSAQYWVSGAVKVITAVASVATAVVLPPVVPHVLALVEAARLSTERKRQLETAHHELERAYDRIKELDEQKTAFFANVSHELRTPLALILGPTESILAAGGNLSEAQRRALAVIRRNTTVLLKHVNDLLDIAALDAGKQRVEYARIDLAHQVRTVAANFDSVGSERSLSFVVAAPDGLEADVDAEKFDRILLNLLANAFKFTPAGGHVRCALDMAGDDRVRLSVEDSGPGVPPELRASIFERFRQATREHGGTGLGLAIAKDFVDLHGGTIVVAEAPGGGAVFEVHLPRWARAGVAVGATPAGAPPGARPGAVDAVLTELASIDVEVAEDPGQADRPLVLVAEDNPEMRRFISEVLRDEYRLVAVRDGAEALATAVAEPPDLVVTDVMMPKLGGDRLVAEMRARPALAQVPVLVLSARADEALRLTLLAESVQDYVTKPFSPNELRARVRNLVVMKRTRTALQQALASQSADLSQLTSDLIDNRTSLQKSLAARQESERRWRAVYENSAVGIGLTDLSGRFLTANPALQRMLGYGEDELRHRSLLELTPEDDREVSRSRVAELVEGRLDEYHVERRYLRKDGGVVWSNTSVSTVPATESGPGMLIKIVEDITERKGAEHALADMRAELARVTRLTTMGELTASIAHEVNQPLAAVITNGNACLRWLAAEPSNLDEAREAIQRIIRDGNRASAVIARIRALVKREKPRKIELSIDEIIREVVSLVQGEARAHDVSVRVESVADLPVIAGDRVQLQQVILNLAMNAIESMSSSKKDARMLEVGADRYGPDAVVVAVRDTGSGLKPEDHERIFDAFYTTKPSGMGMGLAISRSIVEAHGGRLWATPDAAQGATFQLVLPVAAHA
jgi:PAS domain S-box-containing protein